MQYRSPVRVRTLFIMTLLSVSFIGSEGFAAGQRKKKKSRKVTKIKRAKKSRKVPANGTLRLGPQIGATNGGGAFGAMINYNTSQHLGFTLGVTRTDAKTMASSTSRFAISEDDKEYYEQLRYVLIEPTARVNYHPFASPFFLYSGMGYGAYTGHYGVQGENVVVETKLNGSQVRAFAGVGSVWDFESFYFSVDWFGWGLPFYQSSNFNGEKPTLRLQDETQAGLVDKTEEEQIQRVEKIIYGKGGTLLLISTGLKF